MTTASLHPAAQQELLAEIEYLENKESGLGESFFSEVERRVRQATRFPASGAPVLGFEERYDVRSFIVRTFPAAIVTASINGELVVIAVAHTRRAPEYWKSRLG
jgi:toxin ParE1/3/4